MSKKEGCNSLRALYDASRKTPEGKTRKAQEQMTLAGEFGVIVSQILVNWGTNGEGFNVHTDSIVVRTPWGDVSTFVEGSRVAGSVFSRVALHSGFFASPEEAVLEVPCEHLADSKLPKLGELRRGIAIAKLLRDKYLERSKIATVQPIA